MKSNLDALYKTNKDLEKEGIWLDITDDAGFLVRRFGGYNAPEIKKALAKHHKPFARQIQNGSLPEDKEAEILTRTFVEAAIIGWKGIEVDGEVTEFSVEAAVKLLVGLPDLRDELIKEAGNFDNYREVLGN